MLFDMLLHWGCIGGAVNCTQGSVCKLLCHREGCTTETLGEFCDHLISMGNERRLEEVYPTQSRQLPVQRL